MSEKAVVFDCETLHYGHNMLKSPPCDYFSVHTHSMYELLYFIKGDATHVIEDRKYKLKKGDLILIRPSRYHFIQIDSSEDYERINILFDSKAMGIDNAESVCENIEVINLSGNMIAQNILQKMDFYFNRLNKDDFYKVMAMLLGELFVNLSISDTENQAEYSVINPMLSNALKYINANLFTLKNINEVARALFVTESYLFRLFKNELKSSPKKYITDKRLIYAQGMLLLGEKSGSVCEKCGFSDYTTFYRSYVKFFGHPPSDESKTKDRTQS